MKFLSKSERYWLHPDRLVRMRANAVLTLGLSGDMSQLSFLDDLLRNDPDKEVRIAAAWAMAYVDVYSANSNVYLRLEDAKGIKKNARNYVWI